MKISILSLTLFFISASAWGADFRMYTANKLLQQDQIFTTNGDEPGCHNLLVSRRVYRVAQIGYESCRIYRSKDCSEGDELTVSWKQERAPTTEVTQGARWFLISDNKRGAKMSSWFCEAK